MKSWPLFPLGLLVIAGVARSTTWQVTFDPGNTVDRIGVVVAQTSDGDTILVGPGTYYEHIPLPNHGLTLIGTEGSGSTVLDGSQSIAGREGSVLYAINASVPNLHLAGVTLRNGSGSAIPGRTQKCGGGLMVQNLNDDGAVIVTISKCEFSDNSVYSSGSLGGGIYLENVGSSLEGCAFQRSIASQGGHIYAMGGSHTFKDCVFNLEGSISSGGLAVNGFATSLTFEDCTFNGSSDPPSSDTSISTNGGWTVLTGNRFIDNDNPSATSISVNSGFIVGTVPQHVILRNNLFERRGTSAIPTGHWVDIAIETGVVQAEGNTFVNSRLNISTWYPNEGVTFRRNVLWQTPSSIQCYSGGVVSCNDVWPDLAAMVVGCCGFQVEAELNADPLFCDPANGDFHIAAQSPCAASNSPAGCDLIGAFDVGCSATPVKKTSWGEVKHLFR
jgi:hypothetical protein